MDGLMNRRELLAAAPVAGVALATAGAVHAATAAQTRDDAAAADGGGHIRTVAMEEHFMFPEFVEYFDDTRSNINPALFERALPALSDFGQGRLDVMDRNGVDHVVLSLSGPGVQIEPDTAKATRLARLCNDRLDEAALPSPRRVARPGLPGLSRSVGPDSAHRVGQRRTCGGLGNNATPERSNPVLGVESSSTMSVSAAFILNKGG